MRLQFSLILTFLLLACAQAWSDPLVQDYDAADQLYRNQLQSLKTKGEDNTELYAKTLVEHAAVLRHLFNFSEAQTEEAQAARIQEALKKPGGAKSNQPVPRPSTSA